jgi:hypothetical protein
MLITSTCLAAAVGGALSGMRGALTEKSGVGAFDGAARAFANEQQSNARQTTRGDFLFNIDVSIGVTLEIL